MFEALSDKLKKVLKDLRGQGRLAESHIEAAMREIRIALLEADVNFKVVKSFVDRVKEKALGQEVMGSLSPAQQDLRKKYYKGYIPHVVVLDATGTAVYDSSGEVDEAAISGLLDKALR